MQCHYRFALIKETIKCTQYKMCYLEDVVEHRRGVFVVGLHLAWCEGDQPSPGMAEVSAVAPGQLVLVILHLETKVVPGDPLLAGLS